MCLFAGLLSSTAAPLEFARDIRPLLSDACYNCHGPDAKARKASLRLDDRPAAHNAGVLTGEQRAKLAQWLRAGAATIGSQTSTAKWCTTC